jgi:hypothetical protein
LKLPVFEGSIHGLTNHTSYFTRTIKNSKEDEKDSDLVLSKDEVNYWYDLFKGKKNAG